MKLLYLILLACMLPTLAFGQERSVTIDLRAVALEAADGMDVTTAGKWFVQFNQDDWIKKGKTLYPDKSDRTGAVADAQEAFKLELDKYVIAALNAGKFTQDSTGTGVTLSARTSFNYFAVGFEDGVSCMICVRSNNKQYDLTLFTDLRDETAAATTARANMVTELAKISTAADAGGFIK